MQAVHTQAPVQNAYQHLASDIKAWGKVLGFAEVGITDTDLSKAEAIGRFI